MRWPWQRAVRTTTCPLPRLLASATPGIAFEAVYTLRWRPMLRLRPNLDDLVRTDIHQKAAETAARWDAADLPAAQDALNASLGAPHEGNRHYRILAAQAVLRLAPESREHLAQRTADTERVRRLQFLKTQLYDHPGLVVLDRLERHPGRLPDEETAALQRLARTIKACDQWWYPMLEQWERLGDGFSDTDKQQRAMLALLNSVTALNGGTPPAAQAHAN
ncbi:hypothetical protein [Streptomyces sp. ISL-98]|uniref:hypothetical protein n=1 Tax=Streptomyces sp. ISL-98 TaxID=2819192 RepID=UPI0020361657|nr:hypothetical protein [Streptomyces sp. ISL-98]